MREHHLSLEKTMGATLLLLMTLLGVFPLDVILPSFPALASEFATDPKNIAYSVSIFALGVSLSQLFIGPISDTIGRKRLLLAGLFVSAASAIGCLLVSNFEAFMLFRLLQAIGCGCFVLSHAVVQDLYVGKQRTRMRILLTSASGLFISLSPLAGSVLQHYFNWQGSFALFAMLAVCCTLMTLKFLQERTAPARQHGLIPSYITLMKDRAFMTLTIFSCLTFACHFSFIVASPLLFMERLGLSTGAFGVVFTGYGLAYVLGGVIAHWLNDRTTPKRQIGLGFTLIGCSGVACIIWGLLAELSIGSIMLPMIVCTTGITIIRPAATTQALARHPQRAGAAASLSNTLLFAFGALISAMIAMTGNGLSMGLATAFILTGLLGWFLLIGLGKEDLRFLAET